MSDPIPLIQNGNSCHLDIALRHAQAGIYVFPCNGDRSPRTTNGFKDGAIDEFTIRRWWKSNPDALVGIACGLSGLIVFDCDQKKGHTGVKDFMDIANQYGIDLSQCPSTVTPSFGGRHAYFALPPGFEHGNGRGDVPKGIDVRCAGYVIAAGCELPDGGRYEHLLCTPDLPTACRAGTVPVLPDALRAMLTAETAENGPPGGARVAAVSPDPAAPMPACGVPTERERTYAAAALSRTHADLASRAPRTGRNQALNDAALAMGEMVAAGWIERAEVERALLDACQRNAYLDKDGKHAALATLRSGLEAGMRRPRAPLADGDLPILSGVAALFAKVKADAETAAVRAAQAGDMADLVNPATLQGIDPPERKWIVDDWLPVGTVTSLYGGGGFGKTLLAQQLQTSTALGAPFLGLATVRCRSLAFYCEDDGDELHRRQRGICWHHGAQMSDLGAMRWQARVGKENVMATVANGLLHLSEFHGFIRRAVLETGAELVILDNIAQLFGGNENARPEVTQFVNALGAIALEHNAAVLLLGHPGKAADSQYSGSTGWDAAVRSRWLLERPKIEAGDDGATAPELADLRTLRKPKANYAGSGDEIALRWVRGAFQVEGTASMRQAVDTAERAASMAADERAFLDGLDALAGQGRHTSASNRAVNYAPRLMVGKPAAAGLSCKRLVEAMERLFIAGVIEVGPFGRDKSRRGTSAIVRKPCSTVQPVCSTVTCNPLESLLHSDAARCSTVADNSLKTLQHGCSM